MAKSSFLKGFGKPFGILAILFIISIVFYYLYNNYTLEGLTLGKKATVEEATVEGYREGNKATVEEAMVEGYREGRRGRSGRGTTLGANGQRYSTGW
jgi:hypothetical protein